MMLLEAFAALAIASSAAAINSNAPSPTPPGTDRVSDIIYSRPDGTALTMDEFIPARPNGKVVIVVVSGGWFSSHGAIDAGSRKDLVNQLTARGYKVYAVVHRSAPRFTIEDAVADVTRAVRFIRERETDDGRTSVSIGITGASAGGHLSLMAGTTGDDGNTNGKDSLERIPSRVQAVGCYFPPTDFLNYGAPQVNVMETTVGKFFPSSFDFQRQAELPDLPPRVQGQFEDVTVPAERDKILRDISPVYHVTPDDAPTLIIHGDADALVPIQQAELFVKKMEAAGIDAVLTTKPGAAHGWAGIERDNTAIVDWFDQHL